MLLLNQDYYLCQISFLRDKHQISNNTQFFIHFFFVRNAKIMNEIKANHNSPLGSQNERLIIVHLFEKIGADSMRHSRTEVARWRMMRQAIRKRRRWLEGQSRRNFRIYKLRKLDTSRKHRALLFVQHIEWNS